MILGLVLILTPIICLAGFCIWLIWNVNPRPCKHPPRCRRVISIERVGAFPWECPSCVNARQITRCDRCGAQWTSGIRVLD